MAPQRCSSLNCQNLQTCYLTWQKRPCNTIKVKDFNTTILDCPRGPNLISGVLKSGRGNKRVGNRDVMTDEETEKIEVWEGLDLLFLKTEEEGQEPVDAGSLEKLGEALDWPPARTGCQFYDCKALDSTNNPRQQGNRFSTRAFRKEYSLLTPWF